MGWSSFLYLKRGKARLASVNNLKKIYLKISITFSSLKVNENERIFARFSGLQTDKKRSELYKFRSLSKALS